jgi:hypothetical protein
MSLLVFPRLRYLIRGVRRWESNVGAGTLVPQWRMIVIGYSRVFAKFAWSLGLLMSAGTAHATMLTTVQGGVLVNQGDGFKAVKGALSLKVGDAVMVQLGGSAQIVFADGCQYSAAPGSATAITAQSPCAARASFPKPSFSGVNDPQDPREAPPAAASAAPFAISPGLAVLGGLAVVGAGVAIANSSRGSNRRSASP